ncbi:secondary metabolism regulator LAE1 [Colletotrichum spaethianum]|uniref:Secondary metabolism regulator LAE1 n=1 Tax=Colletotrichum spaethianum TaxID=700344 RepID=A0AA37P2N8_9PEZI|nr:secondary metabolism regulator LAE1 [Colletotrichum spaethianum]GKT46808.1 secondary metabolism regulator LAE1 [Colletotrichum spaethianum]
MEIDILTRSENPAIASDTNHIFRKWAPLFWEAGDVTGRTFRIAQDDGRNPILMETCMRNAGFVDVVHKKWKVPIGGWPKDSKLKKVGLLAGLYVDQSLDGWAVKPIGEILGWTFEEVMTLVATLRKTLGEPKSLPYFNL